MRRVPFNESIPMYHQIAEALRQRANAGDLQQHTEQALCREFGVSRTTIRQGLGVLKREGLLQSRRGVGTRLIASQPKPKYTRSHGDPLHAALGSRPRVISRKLVDAPAQVAGFLGIGPGEKALRILRVNDLDGAPLSVVVSHLHGRLAAQITRAALKDPLHEVLYKRCGLRQKRSVHSINVARADAEIASLLGIGLTDPVLHIRSLVYLPDGAPVRWTNNYFREDRYEYTAEMLWNEPGQ